MSQSESFLPFVKPAITEPTIEAVSECLRSGWLASGPRVLAFEEKLKAYTHAPYLLTVTSGTAALHLALKAMGVGPGDEVILPSMTFVATANTIVENGAHPVFVDIDDTFNMDVHKVEAAITPKTKVIIPVHFTGMPVDLTPIYALAKRHNLRVLEDAAQAIGAHYKGRPIGGFGDTQAFSFQATKNVSAGEGGAISFADEEMLAPLKRLRFHGIDRDAWDRFTKKGSQHYDVVEAGYKNNMPDINAAIGLQQLAEVEDNWVARNKMAQRYLEAFQDWPELTLQHQPVYDHRHAWHLFTVLINPDEAGMDRDTFMAHMKAANIGTGLHYAPVHLFRFYRDTYGCKEGDLPMTEKVGARIVSLPFFVGLTVDEQTRVIETMRQIFKKG